MASNNDRRRLRRPKFSTVIALFALFAALGGTAFAAKQVINGKDIKKGTVSSKAVKDGTLKTKDISSKAQSELQGQKGPQGDPGVGEAFAAGATNTALLIADNPQDNILELDGLTAGQQYVVQAKAQVGNGNALRVDCTISRGGTEIDSALWAPSGDFSGTTLALQGLVSGSGTSIVMGCDSGGGSGTVTNRKITAIPVG